MTSAPPASAAGPGTGAGKGAGMGGGVVGGIPGGVASTVSADAAAGSAGISLYKRAQELEQLTRTDKDQEKNAPQIKAIKDQLSDAKFVTGFGSIGGEEFFSYLNLSDSLRRSGGPEWQKWNADMKTKIVKMQNEDGTWAGHHCITGRVAVTSAAILTLVADREPPLQATSLKELTRAYWIIPVLLAQAGCDRTVQPAPPPSSALAKAAAYLWSRQAGELPEKVTRRFQNALKHLVTIKTIAATALPATASAAK
jgi:hypothetical protein